MKLKFLKIAIVLVLAAFAKPASAQELGPEWGGDDSTRMANYTIYSFFQESFKLKLYDEALDYYRQVVASVPKARATVYAAAINIYRDKFHASTDEAERKAYVDTLMTVYDTYLENFRDDPEKGHAYIADAKAADYMNLMSNDRETVRNLLKEAVEADKTAGNTKLLDIYFNQLTDDYELFQTLSTDEYLAAYDYVASRFDISQSETKEEDREVFDALAVRSGALGCENLEVIYAPRLDADPQDAELFEKALNLLRRNNCVTPFFMSVAERLHALKPSAFTALVLAEALENKNQYTEAIKYLNTALGQETDPGLKESLYIRLSINNLGAKNAQAAAANARQAIALNPNSGLGYYAYAQALVLGSSACERGFPQQSVYWLVYDNLAKARGLLADTPNQIGDIDKQMADYRNSFPSAEETFFESLTENSSYEVKCGWITGTTTVRTAK